MYIRKTFILNSLNNDLKKSVCNIEKDMQGYNGTIRLYNFENEPDGILSLAIVSNKRVVKSGLIRKSHMLYKFQFDDEVDLHNCSIAVINVAHGNLKPILFSSTSGEKVSDEELNLISSLGILDEKLDVKNIEASLNDKQIYLEEQNEIEKEIDLQFASCEDCHEKCSNCKYREAFYDEMQDQKQVDNNTFLDQISEQLDYLFSKYPEEEFLCQIFPNSKWAKIDYESNGEFYVVGVIYENEKAKYVCYGVPGLWQELPPEDLKGFTKWLPLDTEKPKEYGYWLSYQDAASGDNIEINII